MESVIFFDFSTDFYSGFTRLHQLALNLLKPVFCFVFLPFPELSLLQEAIANIALLILIERSKLPITVLERCDFFSEFRLFNIEIRNCFLSFLPLMCWTHLLPRMCKTAITTAIEKL